MFKSKRTELAKFMQHERNMTRYLYSLLENNTDLDLASILFLEQYPGEEETLDLMIKEFYGE